MPGNVAGEMFNQLPSTSEGSDYYPFTYGIREDNNKGTRFS